MFGHLGKSTSLDWSRAETLRGGRGQTAPRASRSRNLITPNASKSRKPHKVRQILIFYS